MRKRNNFLAIICTNSFQIININDISNIYFNDEDNSISIFYRGGSVNGNKITELNDEEYKDRKKFFTKLLLK